MVIEMNDIFLILAGCLGMIIAIVHGILGEKQVVRPIRDLPRTAKRVASAVMFLSALYWFVGGMVLVASPFYLEAGDRFVAAMIVAAMYLSGMLANIWATRGRHFGWALLGAATILTVAGA